MKAGIFTVFIRGGATKNVSYAKCQKNIIMKVPHKIPIYIFSATLGQNDISNIIFFKAPALACIFSDTWSSDIFFVTTSTIRSVSISIN